MHRVWHSDQYYAAVLTGQMDHHPSVLHVTSHVSSKLQDALVEEVLAQQNQVDIFAIVHDGQVENCHQFDPNVLQLSDAGIYNVFDDTMRVYHPGHNSLTKEGWVLERKRHIHDDPQVVTSPHALHPAK